jgi:hypothetical protein
MDYTTPALVGLYAAGGLYVARYLKGSSQEIGWAALGTAAAVGAGSSIVGSQISSGLVCPHSPGAPICESASSAAVAWGVVWAMNDMDSANMFVPVQFGAHMLALYVAPYVRAYTVSGKSDDMSEDSSSWDLGALFGTSSSSSSEEEKSAVQAMVDEEDVPEEDDLTLMKEAM